LEAWVLLSKDHVISYFPDCPTHQDDNLHEEWDLQLNFEIVQVLNGVCTLIHLDIDPCPTLSGKWAIKK
jgi:hypothetical protein